MTTCGQCTFFFRISRDDPDFEEGCGDCVLQKQDQKGRYWISKPAHETDAACNEQRTKH